MVIPETTLRDIEPLELFNLLLDRLRSVDTIAFATALENKSRVRAMEFCVEKTGTIYMLTEGGMKVRDIILNPQVSLAAWNQSPGEGLWGISISGDADITDAGDVTRFPLYYETYSRLIGRTMPKADDLPMGMKAIRVLPNSIELFDPMLPDEGYSSKQLWRR